MSEMQQVTLHVIPFKGQLVPPDIRTAIIAANQQLGWSPEQSMADFDNEHVEYYVMMRASQVCGYVGLLHLYDEASLNVVYIDPALRNQGLGRYLLQFVLDQLAARAIQHIFLEVREQNVAAQRLYLSVGFEQLTIRKNYYKNPTEHAVIMQKRLASREEEDNG